MVTAQSGFHKRQVTVALQIIPAVVRVKTSRHAALYQERGPVNSLPMGHFDGQNGDVVLVSNIDKKLVGNGIDKGLAAQLAMPCRSR